MSDDLTDRLHALTHGTPKMNGSEVVSWPLYADRPGQVMVTIPRPVVAVLAEARDEIARLEAERRDHLWLLKGSRLTLDAIAVGREGPADAAAQAQRIVDHIGHGVTDEPPHTLVENDRLRDEITRLTERLQDSWYVDIGVRLDAAVAENARLREGIAAAVDAYDPYGDHQVDAIRALVDAPSTASPVRDDTNNEQDSTTT